jgi:hypothetical protein
VRLGVLGEPPTLDPFGRRATTLTWAVARPLYRSLFRISPKGTAIPDLAIAAEEVPGGALVSLREARWSDGRTIVAADVVRSARRARPPSGFAGLRARARGEAAVLFRGRAEDWEERLARLTFVLPAGRAAPRYSGPFALARRRPGLKLVLEPNGAWDGDQPLLDRIEVQFVTSLRTLIELLATRRLEVAWLPSSVNLGQRLDERGIPYSSVLGTESVYLDPSAADMSAGQRAWVADRIDLEHLHEGLIREDGRIAAAPEHRVGPRKPPDTIRITIPAGDELLALLAQNLQIQLGPRNPVVEIAVADPSVVYGGGEGDPGGLKLIRGFGVPPAGSIPMFKVATYIAFDSDVVGIEVNATFEGPVWNAQAWGLDR